MKKIITVFLLTASTSIFAQMKVGNNPTTINANAVLDIESTNKGLLLPRVMLTSTTAFTPLAAHVAGMNVYNTATAGDVTPGNYFNDGTKWIRIAGEGAASTEPWNNIATSTFATSNLQDIYQMGKVGIGTNSIDPDFKVKIKGGSLIISNDNDNYSGITSTTFNQSKLFHPYFLGLSSKGGDETNPIFCDINAPLLFLAGRDYKSNKNRNTFNYGGASITFYTSEATTNTNKGTRMEFAVTQNGTDTEKVGMVIADNGNVGIGTNLTPKSKLNVEFNSSDFSSTDQAAGAYIAGKWNATSNDINNVASNMFLKGGASGSVQRSILGGVVIDGNGDYSNIRAVSGEFFGTNYGSPYSGKIRIATGLYGAVEYLNTGTGVIENARGTETYVTNLGNGIIENAVGLLVNPVQATNVSAKPHTAIGIRIVDGIVANGGTTNNTWSIYNESPARNFFAGSIGIGTNNPTS